MPAGKIYVNRATIPRSRYGFSSVVLQEHPSGWGDGTGGIGVYDTSGLPGGDNNNRGAFRIGCTVSHYGFDDPIVWPGQAGRTHLHAFFGNTTTRSSTDLANMATHGNSTCAGGTLNRSGYWVPVFIYHCPANDPSPCNKSRDGEVIPYYVVNAYYKCEEYNCGDYVTWPQPGHRMIAGNASATTPNHGAGRNLRFDCGFTGTLPLENGYHPDGTLLNYDHIPTAAESLAQSRALNNASGHPGAGGSCSDIDMLVSFDQCWNGVDLDVPDHSSHMKPVSINAAGDTESPPNSTAWCIDPAFPVRFPSITFNAHIEIHDPADLDYLVLSSDPARATWGPDPMGADRKAGFTIHADWVNGWSTAPISQHGTESPIDMIKRNCYRKGHVPHEHGDCHNNLIGIAQDGVVLELGGDF